MYIYTHIYIYTRIYIYQYIYIYAYMYMYRSVVYIHMVTLTQMCRTISAMAAGGRGPRAALRDGVRGGTGGGHWTPGLPQPSTLNPHN